MSGSVNKVILVGTLGKDPEIRSMQNGGRVCNLSVATSESWKDKATGEKKEKTEWNRVTIWNEHLVVVAEKFLTKGSKVYIEGTLETRKWQDQSGQDKYSTEVVLKQYRGELQILDSRRSDEGAAQPRPTSGPSTQAAPQAGYAQQPHQTSVAPSNFDLDSEIPF